LEIFSPQDSLICDQVWINVGAYGPKFSHDVTYYIFDREIEASIPRKNVA